MPNWDLFDRMAVDILLASYVPAGIDRKLGTEAAFLVAMAKDSGLVLDECKREITRYSPTSERAAVLHAAVDRIWQHTAHLTVAEWRPIVNAALALDAKLPLAAPQDGAGEGV